MGEVPTEFSFFFLNFERMLYWYEMKAYIFKNLFLTDFFILFVIVRPQLYGTKHYQLIRNFSQQILTSFQSSYSFFLGGGWELYIIVYFVVIDSIINCLILKFVSPL